MALSQQQDRSQLTFRAAVAFVVVAFVVFLLIIRLFYLQIVQGEHFKQRSENNRFRTLYLPAPRGVVTDREGRIVADNRPSFNLEFVKEDCPDVPGTLTRLADILQVSPDILKGRLARQKKRKRFEAKIVARDLDRDLLAKVLAHRYELPGVIAQVAPTRNYLTDSLMSHVVGYTREVSAAQLELNSFLGYQAGDIVGQYGLEQVLERSLQGERGIQRLMVNAGGSKIGEFARLAPTPGSSVRLTIDLDLQRAAMQALGEKRGAVVALNPSNGEVLALVSTPSFDANQFSGEITAENWQRVVQSPDKPLTNRSLQGAYPPGSIYKVVTAAAALGEKIIGVHDKIHCPGYYMLGRKRFQCHKKSGHGPVSFREALLESCDVYFYTLGVRLGVDVLYSYARKFGLGEKTRLELVRENAGLIPSTTWKKKAFRKVQDQKWYAGETPSVAIGQGAVLVTPIQMARAYAALVNGGQIVMPHVVAEVQQSTESFSGQSPNIRGRLDLAPSIFSALREGLSAVVNDPRGTGKKARLAEGLHVSVAGKTGTAQVAALELHGTKEAFNDHAWFVGYAPAEQAEIVVAAIVENAGHGGAMAAPVVKAVMSTYFNKKNPPRVLTSEGGAQ